MKLISTLLKVYFLVMTSKRCIRNRTASSCQRTLTPMLTTGQKWREKLQTCVQYLQTFLISDSERFFSKFVKEMKVVVFLESYVYSFVIEILLSFLYI